MTTSTSPTRPSAGNATGLSAPAHPRWPTPLRVAVGFVGFILTALALPVGLMAGGGALGLPPPVLAPLTLVTFALAIVVLVAGLTALDRRGGGWRARLAHVGLRWSRRDAAALGGAVALVMAPILVVHAVLRLTGQASPVPGVAELSTAVVIGGLVYALVPSFLMQGFPEELFFRGWLLNTVRAREWAAVLVSSVLFGSLHVLSQSHASTVVEKFVLYPLMATALGFACCAARLATGSLWAAVGIHGGMHMATRIAVLYAMPNDVTVHLVLQVVTLTVVGVALLVWRSRLARSRQTV